MQIANISNMDTSHEQAGASFSELATRATARRLRRTRQHLGAYRHDLLVAMRVVNSIEREILRAEWENWLLDENTRCKQAQMLLQDNSNPSNDRSVGKADGQQVMDIKDKRMKNLRSWQEEYCGSCRREQEALHQGQHLGFM
jgi:hypothetical protein